MKNGQLANATIASFEMGIESTNNVPRLPMSSSSGSGASEREFLLHAFYKLCRKRGRRSARCAFTKKQ